MANDQNQNPTTGAESDISKAQSQQQPPSQARQQENERGEREGQFETGQQGQQGQPGQQGSDSPSASPDAGLQDDTLEQGRTDVEGGSLASRESGEAGSGFIGSEGQRDSSGQLIEEEDEDFARDGQGAPEGK